MCYLQIFIYLFIYLQLTKFTKMNVWVYYLYWSNKYPVGPDDPICRVATMKRNQTEVDEEKFPVVPDENNLWILKFSPFNLITCILQFSCLH